MCGISAVYGQYAPLKAMYMTLNQLERGTQGCGVAYTCNNSLRIVKEATHPAKFMNDRLYDLNLNVKTAIAHNRLPSIGKVSYENTHPFLSCNGYFALAHNGHAFLGGIRDWLIRKGHRFSGQTDSEVLTHILEECYADSNDMLKAIRELVVNYLSGTVVVLTSNGEVYSAKSGSQPLHYAVMDNEIYIASTKKAVESLLNILNVKDYEVIEIEDNEVLRVKNGKVDHLKIEQKKKKWNYNYYPNWRYDRYLYWYMGY